MNDTEILAQIHYMLVYRDYQGQSIVGKMIEYIKEKYRFSKWFGRPFVFKKGWKWMVVFFLKYLKKMSKIKLTLNKINVIVVTNIKVAQNKLIGGSYDKNIGGSIRTY